MKFDDLYNRVFLQEQDEPSDINTEVAHPNDFDDVEPLPVPEPGAQPAAEGQPALPITSSLTDYVNQIEDFANKLNGTDGSSLQTLASQLDKPLTPFEGLHNRTSSDIEAAAKTLRTVAEKLKNFIIAAAKK